MLHEVLALIDLQNESSRDFKELLRRCFISSQYMQHSEVNTKYYIQHKKCTCFTRDQGAAGSSLTGVTALWSLSKTHLS